MDPCTGSLEDEVVKPRLISFKLCPFVQRVAITLQYKGVDHDIDYIELADPPDWFLALSPRKKVPVLQVGDEVLFESTAINEYVDEAHEPRLHPDDLILRAHNRAWIEFGNACMWHALHLTTAEDREAFDRVVRDLLGQFDELEPQLHRAPFFNGEAFSLVDASYAPLLQRLTYIDELRPGVLDAARHPNLVRWTRDLMKVGAVRRSHVRDLRALYHELIWKRQGHLSTCLDADRYERPTSKSRY